MIKSFNFILACLLFLMITSLQAQETYLTTKNKKAIKHYEMGSHYYEGNHFPEAEKELLSAIKEDTSFIEAYLTLGQIYTDKYNPDNNYEKALVLYLKVININPSFFPNVYFLAAQIEVTAAKYAGAEGHYEKFLSYPAKNSKVEWESEVGLDACKFAIYSLAHPVPFDPKNMGAAINTSLNEYFPAITGDGITLLFTRRLPDDMSPDGFQEDIFISQKINGEWATAVNAGEPLNTPHFNEGAPTLSADSRLLIYASSRPDGRGSCDLYYSFRHGNRWSAGRNLGYPINTSNWESQPSLSSDGKTLYFVRADRMDNPSTQDIYVTNLSDSNTWSFPVKMSDTINTPGREETPFIAADNETFYFCSDGHPGMGGTDIFISRRLPNGRWGIPKNLGYPINTNQDETGLIVNPDGKTAYFASDRKGGYGGLDLYQFTLYDSIRPVTVTYMKGIVEDAKTHQPLSASFNLTDLQTGRTIMRSSSAKEDGSFLVCLPVNKNIALNVSKNGYLFYSENFSLQDMPADAIHPFLKNIPLQPIDTGAIIVLKNIFFETNKYDLKKESQVELDKLVMFLKNNPAIKVEISGHTDNVGTHTSNQVLSENRAKSVTDYLIAHTIPAERLTSRGYAETHPIATNDTPEGRSQNRRTEMKITGK